jgi:uncharacterized protein YndB with AHSA1/START domain
MNSRYKPGPAAGAEVRKEQDDWCLLIVRELPHPPGTVWQALTDPAELREWAPFDADHSLASVGPVTLSTVGTPASVDSRTEVTRAQPPELLEYRWGGNDLRWMLEKSGAGTRLTLWHRIDRRYIAMGAAGWHICLDVLKALLDGKPFGRIVGGEAMKYEWPRLHAEYAKQFGIESAPMPPHAPSA